MPTRTPATRQLRLCPKPPQRLFPDLMTTTLERQRLHRMERGFQRHNHVRPGSGKRFDDMRPRSSLPFPSPFSRTPLLEFENNQSSPGKTSRYALPLGPYSDQRPFCCYAALIGQAILSSPQHRLVLRDIYEWIATVYPYFKFGQNTWMNIHFRKVRIEGGGKFHWAIFDEDLECFINGGYRSDFGRASTQQRNGIVGDTMQSVGGAKRPETMLSQIDNLVSQPQDARFHSLLELGSSSPLHLEVTPIATALGTTIPTPHDTATPPPLLFVSWDMIFPVHT
ncbi:hypothetical protein B0H14DRAFT_3139046 [Mycena olivaceomarginata]|nr:hypothetical protein B0H14DRAFT_3139046 [Mycena olivaceomarginata]